MEYTLLNQKAIFKNDKIKIKEMLLNKRRIIKILSKIKLGKI